MDIDIDYTSKQSINSSGGDLEDHVRVEDPPVLHHQISSYEYSSLWPLHHHQLHQIPSSSSTHDHPLHPHHHQDQLIANYHQHHHDNHNHHVLLAAAGNNNNNIFMELDDHEEDRDEAAASEEELGAMKEMMYKIAAMQPVDIDPATIRKPKRRNVRISDDPQSVAARHRRERISEKIRILQRLVPGGTKMDTASMLDEAIRYVKFLKRQIRLLQSSSSSLSIDINIDDGHQRNQNQPAPQPAAAHDDHDQCNINIINSNINGSSSVRTRGAGLPLDWPLPLPPPPPNMSTVPKNVNQPQHGSNASSSSRHPDH